MIYDKQENVICTFNGLFYKVFLFLFSKQHENNFQKLECETSFKIIIFTLYLTFKNNF